MIIASQETVMRLFPGLQLGNTMSYTAYQSETIIL